MKKENYSIKLAISGLLFALVMISSGAVSAFGQKNNDKIVAEILKLEAQLTESSRKLSADEFERFYASDFMVTARLPPKIVTGEERLKMLRDRNFRRGTIDSLTNDDIKVRVYDGDTAISTGHWKRTSRDEDGKDTSASGRFTHIWVKQNGKWLLAGVHYSPDIDLEKLRSVAAQNESKKN